MIYSAIFSPDEKPIRSGYYVACKFVSTVRSAHDTPSMLYDDYLFWYYDTLSETWYLTYTMMQEALYQKMYWFGLSGEDYEYIRLCK